MNVEQLLLIAPLIIELIIAVILGVALHRNRGTMAAMIGLIVITSLLMNFLPSPITIGSMKLDNSIHLGLDLQGGVQAVLEARAGAAEQGNLPSRMEAARSIIEERVNGSGVNEPVVQVQGDNRILVELPGAADPKKLIDLIRQTGELEWIDAGASPLQIGQLVCTTRGCPRPEQIAEATGIGAATPTAVISGTPGTVLTGTNGVTTTTTTTATLTAPAPTPTTAITATPVTSNTTGTTASPTPFGGTVYPVLVTGDQVDGPQVKVQYDTTTGAPVVSFVLKGAGQTALADYTTKNVGKYMPIVLDKVVISSPVIKSPITGGQGQIEGMTNSEANALVIKLRYGALPVPLDVVQNSTISGTLGADSIQKSIIAGVVGLLLVMVFMLAYYRLPGLLADLALLIYSLVVFAIFRAWPVTLTLAGIAGFILSIGMAVDANVLIFARIKEELRMGKTIKTAVEAGFDHAWPSIRDSNSTTIIVTAILYWFGSFFGASIIKGFALTLFIGVVISMFTAVLVTRTFLRLVVDTSIAQNRWWFGVDELKTPTAPPPAESETQPLS